MGLGMRVGDGGGEWRWVWVGEGGGWVGNGGGTLPGQTQVIFFSFHSVLMKCEPISPIWNLVGHCLILHDCIYLSVPSVVFQKNLFFFWFL